MADRNRKWPDNVSGDYFVDDTCIDCDACRAEAPTLFTRNDAHGYSYVMKQPETEEDFIRAKAAAEACPVEAIGGGEGGE
jgi:ferredoxin